MPFPFTHGQPVRRARIRRIAAVPVLASLMLTGLALPAGAADGPAALGTLAAPTPANPVQAAQLRAASTGRPVPVTSLSTETTTVTAQPDGSFVQDSYALPIQVKQHGAWTPVSATLHANPNGSYSPAATPTGVVLSGGGPGPLVTLSTPAGQSLSMTLPFTLPVPTVSGGRALYPSVLPGVDLQATVDNQGSFQEVLIVHNAAAAANPALRTLSVATSAHGLKVGTTAAGGLTATEPDGAVAFSGPAPVMWDSNNSAATAATAATTENANTAVSLGRSTAATNGTADTVASSAAGPGPGAQVARVPMSDASGTLELIPDAGLLTAPPGGYPVYVDPPVTSMTGHFVQVYSAANCQTAETYDVAQDYNGVTGEGIGYVQPQWASGCDSGVEEAFYAINLDGIPKDAVVSSAVLTLTEVFGADGGCGNTWPVTVQTVSAISGSTNWDNLPWAATGTPAYDKTEDISSANAGSSCGNKTQTWAGLQDAVGYVAGGMLTLGVYGDTSTASTDYGHMRFSDDPYIQSTYDLYPTIAGANTNPPAVTTDAQGNQVASPACGSSTPGWIGMTSSDNGSAVTMNATTTSPVGNNVATWFTMLDNMLSDGGKAKTVTQTNTPYQGSGTPASRPVSITLQDGHQYTWATQGADGTLTSSTISGCTFDVDLTPPTTPTVTDSDFPPAGSGGTPKFAGTQSTFTFSSTDPAPDPTTCTLHACLPASGVAGFRYSLDQPIGGTSTHYVAANSSGVGTAPITPETWGTHILYVQAMDNAGNVSTVPSSYTFYAPWNPDTVVTAGDLTGDHVPDMLATSSDGDLILLPGNTDPATPAATQIAGYPTSSPDGTTTAPDGWNNFLIAHRGSLTNSGVDDLLAYNKTTGEMYMYGNDMGDGGTPGHFTLTADIHSLSRPPCTSTTRCTGYVQQPNPANPSSWGTLTQMIAPGDLSGTAGSNQGNLITMEGGRLWLYQFSTGQYLLSNPILLGTGDWSNFTLIAPGVIGGDLNAATPTAGTPTLWARDNTTGSLYTFSLAKDASGNFPLLTPPTLSLTLPLTATDGTHMCADDSDSSTTAGNPIQIWECNKTNAQSWTMHTNGTISTIGGNCLDLTDATPVEGTHAELEPCNPALSTEQWTATATGQLKTANGLCLADPTADTTDNNTQLITWGCDNGSEQDWTGGISALTGTSQTGQPFPALTDPVGFGPNLPVASYPQLASPGDKTGLGEPDLYATTPDGEMLDYPGGAPSSAGTANFGSPILQGAYSAATAWWKLADGGTSTTAVDTIGGPTGPNTATLNGSATWTTDTSLTLGNPSLQQANPTSTVLSLDGTTDYAATSGPVVDTTGSFTVSLWANLNAGYNTADYYTVLGQRDATGARCGFYLQYSAAFKGWSLVMPGTDAANTLTYFHAGTGVTPHAGAWTHLVAVYDATTGGMSLYVNGQLAGTGTDTTPWAVPAGGPLLIGGADNGSNGNVADFPGKVSDLHVYSTALSPAAATSIGDNPQPLTGLN